MTNTFWVAANIIFDLRTGATTQVLMLVNRESDATIFETENEAQTYLSFNIPRAAYPMVSGTAHPPKAARLDNSRRANEDARKVINVGRP